MFNSSIHNKTNNTQYNQLTYIKRWTNNNNKSREYYISIHVHLTVNHLYTYSIPTMREKKYLIEQGDPENPKGADGVT